MSNLAIVKDISDPIIYDYNFLFSNLTNASNYLQNTINLLSSLKEKDEGKTVLFFIILD